LGALSYKLGEKVATRNAYGDALKRLGSSDNNKVLVALDEDTKNSTFAITYMKAYPE
jgi:transketolase